MTSFRTSARFDPDLLVGLVQSLEPELLIELRPLYPDAATLEDVRDRMGDDTLRLVENLAADGVAVSGSDTSVDRLKEIAAFVPIFRLAGIVLEN